MIPVQTPPIIQNHIAHAQKRNEHPSRPSRVEPNHHHHTSNQGDDAHSDSCYRPLSRKHKAKEQEDEQDAARELDVLRFIVLAHIWQTRKQALFP
jgi:hypothetical protein